MEETWRDNVPIYRQLRDRIAAMLLDGDLADGDALPSVRELAAENGVNPLTVMKGYQLLVDEGLVESRRGLGMFVLAGAREALLEQRRREFVDREWPEIVATVRRLGIDWDLLLTAAKQREGNEK
jgi:GntR family transcriptional regulator